MLCMASRNVLFKGCIFLEPKFRISSGAALLCTFAQLFLRLLGVRVSGEFAAHQRPLSRIFWKNVFLRHKNSWDNGKSFFPNTCDLQTMWNHMPLVFMSMFSFPSVRTELFGWFAEWVYLHAKPKAHGNHTWLLFWIAFTRFRKRKDRVNCFLVNQENILHRGNIQVYFLLIFFNQKCFSLFRPSQMCRWTSRRTLGPSHGRCSARTTPPAGHRRSLWQLVFMMVS